MKINFLDCRRRRGDLPAFESGELPPERAEALAAHLAVCSRCRTEWESLARVASALRADTPAPQTLSVNLWSRIESELLEPATTAVPAPRRLPSLALGSACAVVLCGLAFAATRFALPTKKAAPAPVVTPSEPAVVVATKPRPTPAPTPKAPEIEEKVAPALLEPSVPKVAPKPSPRPDPFSPRPRRTPRPRPTPDPFDDDPPIAIDAAPPAVAALPPSDPDVRPVADDSELVIRVERPAPSRTVRDASIDAESVERRSEDALGSPLDAVARATQSRKLFP